MAVHGTLAAFNPQKEDWSEYSERLTFYVYHHEWDNYRHKEVCCPS